jgi:mannose-6-phosphate isomerase-like protein (cupin superfamily)
MSEPQSIRRHDALEITETPYGSVGLVHAGRELNVWWVHKEHDEIDPEWTIFTRDDVVHVVQGALKLEIRGEPDRILEAGDVFVIEAGSAFRGYRWPRDSADACVFLAVSAADVESMRAPLR